MNNLMSSILKFIFFNLISFLKNIIAKKKICKITDSNCSREHPARTINIDNSMWGINTIFSEANSIHNHFEHGVFFGDFTQDIQRKNHIERIYTMSPFRKEIIKKRLGKECIVTGNYLNYVEKINLKTKVPKNSVLFFPAHTTLTLKSKEDYKNISTLIKKHHSKSSIYVSLFYLDFLNEEVRESIESYGMIPICFGSRYDPNFLRKFKTFVDEFSFIYTNDIGTHVGYCLALKKDIRYLKVENEIFIMSKQRFNNELSNYLIPELVENQKNKIKSILDFNRDAISDEEDSELNEYFGHRIKIL